MAETKLRLSADLSGFEGAIKRATGLIEGQVGSLAGMATRYLSVVAAVELARRSFMNFANLDLQLRRIALQAGLSQKQVQAMMPAFTKLGELGGESVEAIADSFNTLRERAHLSWSDTQRVFPALVQAAYATNTSIKTMAETFGAMMLNLKIGAGEAEKVMEVMYAAAERGNLNFERMRGTMPEVTTYMKHWGATGVKATADLLARMIVLKQATGDEEEALRLILRGYQRIGDPRLQDYIGRNPRAMRAYIRQQVEAGEDAFDINQRLVEQAQKYGFEIENFGIRDSLMHVTMANNRERVLAISKGLVAEQGKLSAAVTDLKKGPMESVNKLSGAFSGLGRNIAVALNSIKVPEALTQIAAAVKYISLKAQEREMTETGAINEPGVREELKKQQDEAFNVMIWGAKAAEDIKKGRFKKPYATIGPTPRGAQAEPSELDSRIQELQEQYTREIYQIPEFTGPGKERMEEQVKRWRTPVITERAKEIAEGLAELRRQQAEQDLETAKAEEQARIDEWERVGREQMKEEGGGAPAAPATDYGQRERQRLQEFMRQQQEDQLRQNMRYPRTSGISGAGVQGLLQKVGLKQQWDRARPWVEGGVMGGMGWTNNPLYRFLQRSDVGTAAGLVHSGVPTPGGKDLRSLDMFIDSLSGIANEYDRLRRQGLFGDQLPTGARPISYTPSAQEQTAALRQLATTSDETLDRTRESSTTLGEIRDILHRAFPVAPAAARSTRVFRPGIDVPYGTGGATPGGVGAVGTGGIGGAGTPGGGIGGAPPMGNVPPPGGMGPSGPGNIAMKGGEQLPSGYFAPGTSTHAGGGLGGYSASMGPGKHGGDDYMMPHGSPIHSVKPGTVVRYGRDRWGGMTMTVRHDDGSTATYMHLSRRIAPEGSRVGGGQVIGLSGTANGTPHLHLEFKDPQGRRVSPRHAMGIVGGQNQQAGAGQPSGNEGGASGGKDVTGRMTWFNAGPNYSYRDPNTGKVWTDTSAMRKREGAHASGVPSDTPGIATAGQAGLGGYYQVTLPDGRVIITRKVDKGPRGVVDLNAALASQAYPRGMPGGLRASAKYIGRELPPGVVAGIYPPGTTVAGLQSSGAAAQAGAKRQAMESGAEPSEVWGPKVPDEFAGTPEEYQKYRESRSPAQAGLAPPANTESTHTIRYKVQRDPAAEQQFVRSTIQGAVRQATREEVWGAYADIRSA